MKIKSSPLPSCKWYGTCTYEQPSFEHHTGMEVMRLPTAKWFSLWCPGSSVGSTTALLAWSSSCGRAMRDLSFQQMLTRQSPGGLLANFWARRRGLPVPFPAPSPVRADVRVETIQQVSPLPAPAIIMGLNYRFVFKNRVPWEAWKEPLLGNPVEELGSGVFYEPGQDCLTGPAAENAAPGTEPVAAMAGTEATYECCSLPEGGFWGLGDPVKMAKLAKYASCGDPWEGHEDLIEEDWQAWLEDCRRRRGDAVPPPNEKYESWTAQSTKSKICGGQAGRKRKMRPRVRRPAAKVPERQALATAAPQGITTLMLRNIPVKFNRELLLADIDARGFKGKYDVFYLPLDFQTENNLGYAFINLVTPKDAEQFRSTYQGLALMGARSKKICAVVPAKRQGRAANVEYYRNREVMSMEEKYQPLVFESGLRAPFPSPTKAVRPIRYRESRGRLLPL